jgi:hypothetical protein
LEFYIGGCSSSLFNYPVILSVFSGSGPSHSKHRNARLAFAARRQREDQISPAPGALRSFGLAHNADDFRIPVNRRRKLKGFAGTCINHDRTPQGDWVAIRLSGATAICLSLVPSRCLLRAVSVQAKGEPAVIAASDNPNAKGNDIYRD